MDKRDLLDRLAANGDERLLLGRVWDKYEQCRRRNIPVVTGFLSPAEQELVREAFEHTELSARGYNRVLKIARTIADLAGSIGIHEEHLKEALFFRYQNLTEEAEGNMQYKGMKGGNRYGV